MTASHPQYSIVTDSISPHSNSQLLTAIHCDEPNTGFVPRLISAHFFARWSGWRLRFKCKFYMNRQEKEKSSIQNRSFRRIVCCLRTKKRGKSNSVNVELAPKNERNGESLERTIFMKRCKHTDVKGKCWNRFCVEKFIFNDWFHLMLHPSGVKIHHKRILG